MTLFAESFDVMLMGRVLQGLGSGGCFTLGTAIIFDAFKDLITRFPNSKYAADSKLRMQYLVNALAPMSDRKMFPDTPPITYTPIAVALRSGGNQEAMSVSPGEKISARKTETSRSICAASCGWTTSSTGALPSTRRLTTTRA